MWRKKDQFLCGVVEGMYVCSSLTRGIGRHVNRHNLLRTVTSSVWSPCTMCIRVQVNGFLVYIL